jgi:CHASE2 domain-containing sensor protein
MRKQAVFHVFMVLLLGAFLSVEARRDPVAKIERRFADWIAANNTPAAQPARVTLVEINDSSLGDGHAWPWAPLDYALFMEAALQFKPDVIAIEPVLDWPDANAAKTGAPKKQGQYEKILHDSILKAPKVVLGAQLGFPADADAVPKPAPVPVLNHAPGDISAIPEFTIIERQPEEDYRLSTKMGFTNIPVQDGVTRSVPLIFRYHGQLVPSLALQSVIEWLRLTPDEVTVEPGSRIVLGKTTSVPIDAAGRMAVHFQSPVARIDYDDLLLAVTQASEKGPAVPPTNEIKNGILLLARTDKAAATLLFPTLRKGSPGELCAAAIATIQRHAFSRRASRTCDFALIAAGAAFACCGIRFSRKKMLVVSLFALIGYLMLSLTVYSLSLVLMPGLLPLGLLALVNFFNLVQPREK